MLSKNSQFEVCSTVALDMNGSLAGISEFGEDIVSPKRAAIRTVFLRTILAKTTRTVIIIRNPRSYQQYLIQEIVIVKFIIIIKWLETIFE